MEEKILRSVLQEDKTGKSKQGESKGHSVSCCLHTSREKGELGGLSGERERPVVHRLAPGAVVFRSLVAPWRSLCCCVFIFFWAIHKQPKSAS